ncbi:MAG: hypothetical protein WCK29_04580, partial [archaeon]
YLSKGKLGLPNFCRGIADASKKIAGLPDKSVLIVDEASTVFSSKDGMTDATKKLLKIMDVVGQKNLIFILCLPCIFDLTKTIAVRRSLFLCHVYPDKQYNRGQYAYWGEKTKKELYIYGKKNFDSYKQPRYEYNGEYMDFKPPFYQEYLDIVKKESLNEVLNDAMGKDSKRDIKLVEGEFYSVLKDKHNFKINDLIAIKGQSNDMIYERIRAFKAQNS